jgi:phosphoribosyl-dephospho-CoA transferase
MGRGSQVQTHTLLRIAGAAVLTGEAAAPSWVGACLRATPWVVVRRAERSAGCIPVGVRGATRAQRCAAWLQPHDVLEAVSAPELARRRAWAGHPRAAEVPALAALEAVAVIMAAHALHEHWGPAGSVAFELASGQATASAHSDLDLVIELAAPLAATAAARLLRELGALAVRVDALLETPRGGVALAEVSRGRPPYRLRTAHGSCLTDDPWAGAVAAA